jgi:RNA polymerase sigma factor (TIGR02999 family)
MPKPNPHEVTQLLPAWSEGDNAATDQLMPLVYGELRRLAKQHMRLECACHTLQTTALIHEAYLRLIDASQAPLENRRRFFAVASRLMRQALVDLARERGSLKRGGGTERVSLDEALVVSSQSDDELLALDEALQALAEFDERKGQVVELRFFGGLSVEETAEAIDISVETVHSDWRLARAWLLRGGKPNEA